MARPNARSSAGSMAEPALAFLERALARQPAFTAARAAIEPEFESLRGDARFRRLLNQ